MASFNFRVDTDPMAHEIKSVSHHVDAVSGSVIAMQAAVIKAEKEGAEVVCQNVNRGFYSLIQSQISQKIAALTSQVEAKLMDMGQQALALKMIQNRMERDYHMISNRYGKLFNSLNNSLYKRIQEVDKPVIKLIHGDMVITDSRVRRSMGVISTNQSESIQNSQLILTSKTKNDGAEAITSIHKFIKDVNLQKKQSEAVIANVKVDNVCDIYLPISVTEATTEVGVATTNYYSPTSNIEVVDEMISKSARQSAIDATRNGNWQPISPKDKELLDGEFATLLIGSQMDERLKKEIQRMYNEATEVRQLKNSEL